MLHVFLVDIGVMLKLDMLLATESVSSLMKEVQRMVHIPPNKQVLLTSSGIPLEPNNRVASYTSIGTESHPIFLFSKATIESSIPPSPSINLGSEASLKEEVDKSLKMKPDYNTLVARAKLAMVFQQNAIELLENCDNLVNDQILQRDGWSAVMLNLEHILSAFVSHVESFEETYENFLHAQEQYNVMLQSFGQVVILLNQLPLLSCLLGNNTHQQMSLLEWISTQDKQSSLDNLAKQCQDALNKCNSSSITLVLDDAKRVLNQANNMSMKEIKGLNERIVSLQQRSIIVKQVVQDQSDMAQGFQQNQIRAEHIGDASVLPDLCASHKKQLLVLLRNHHQIREIRNLCARAKDELAANLHARLRWVMIVQRSVCEIDSKILVYQQSIKRIKKRLDILEQIYEAPKMYVLAVLEVLRRRNFSAQFSIWMKTVSKSSTEARSEEMEKRQSFHQIFGNHFVKNLFPGIDGKPEPFAEEPQSHCDSTLPVITPIDVQLLQQVVPELMCELNLTEALDTSIIVRDCLSQSNLTKLIDPSQNKTLKKTLTLRQNTLTDNSSLTMSVLKREMSCQEVEEFPFPSDVQFHVGSATSDTTEHKGDLECDFEPESLSSLNSEKKLINSSDSDALFMSAELDFSMPNNSLSKLQQASSPAFGKSSQAFNQSSSMFGKSISSPIRIQGFHLESSGQSNRGLCQSLSPNLLTSPKKERVFSLPLNTKTSPFSHVNSLSCGSEMSGKSLSQALQSSKVEENINNSADTVRNLMSQIHVAKIKLCDMQMTFKDEIDEYKTELNRNKAQIIEHMKNVLDEQALSNLLKFSIDEYNNLIIKVETSSLDNSECLKKITENKETSVNFYNILIQHLTPLLNNLSLSYCEIVDSADKDGGSSYSNGNIELSTPSSIEKFNNIKTEKEEITLKYNSLQQNYDELKNEILEINKKLEEVNSQNNIIKSENETLGLKNKNLTCEILQLQELLTLSSNKTESLENQMPSLNESLQKSTEKQLSLKEQVSSLQESLLKYIEERDQLKNELSLSHVASQNAIDEQLTHVSTVNLQIKDLKKQLAEKDQQLNITHQLKDDLESQKQMNFNQVVNKIRKEKEQQIQEVNLKNKTLEKELSTLRLKNDTFLHEINAHKEAYSIIEEQYNNVNALKQELLTQIEKTMNENETKNETLNKEITDLKEMIEDIKNDKLKVMQELKLQYDEELEKEKKSLLLQMEIEKETAIEQMNKCQHVENVLPTMKSISIEEGIDELEISTLLEQVKSLKMENEALKSPSNNTSLDSSTEVTKNVDHRYTEILNKLELKEIDVGSIIILYHDTAINQYVGLTIAKEKHFLHPESKRLVSSYLAGNPEAKRYWMFAVVIDKEYCITKKAQNKFSLPVGSYFTRIQVKPYPYQK